MQLKEIIEEHGDKAEQMIYDIVLRKSLDFSDWLKQRAELNDIQRDRHLQNGHLFIELLAENTPFIFPEEIEDDEEDINKLMRGEESSADGFKYFVYNLYTRRGPGPGPVAECLLDSLTLYFHFMVETGLIGEVPMIVEKTLEDKAKFRDHFNRYHKFDAELADNIDAWNSAFDQWSADYYDL